MLFFNKKGKKILSILFITISLMLYIFLYDILTIAYRFMFPNPVVWKNIQVDLPEQFIARKGSTENKLQILNWRTVKRNSLMIEHRNLNGLTPSTIFMEYKADNDVHIYESREFVFQGESSFYIKLHSKKSGDDINLIYVFAQDTIIAMIGKNKDEFSEFDTVLSQFKFMPVKAESRG